MCRAELAGEEPQEQQRGRVGRVQIVQDEHDRPALGGVAQELGGRVEQAKARALGVQRGRLRQVGEALAQLGHQLGELAAPAPSCARSAAGIASRT